MAQRILRPLDYGDILDETFDIYRENFVLLVGIAAVLNVPVSVVSACVSPTTAIALQFFVVLPISLAVTAATTWAVSRVYLGEAATIVTSYRTALRRFLSFLLTMALVFLVAFGAMIVLVVPGTALAVALAPGSIAGGILVGATVLVASCAGIYFLICFAFVSEVFVIEGMAAGAALTRSRALARGQFWRIFVVGAVTTLLQLIVVGMAGAMSALLPEGTAISILGGLLEGVVQAGATPLQVIAFVLLYYDVRIRKEGFDLEILAASLGSTAPAAPSGAVPPVLYPTPVPGFAPDAPPAISPAPGDSPFLVAATAAAQGIPVPPPLVPPPPEPAPAAPQPGAISPPTLAPPPPAPALAVAPPPPGPPAEAAEGAPRPAVEAGASDVTDPGRDGQERADADAAPDKET